MTLDFDHEPPSAVFMEQCIARTEAIQRWFVGTANYTLFVAWDERHFFFTPYAIIYPRN